MTQGEGEQDLSQVEDRRGEENPALAIAELRSELDRVEKRLQFLTNFVAGILIAVGVVVAGGIVLGEVAAEIGRMRRKAANTRRRR